jgi:spermidine/putrescine transport system ATP-binding protein
LAENAVEARHVVKAFGQGEAAVRALDDVSVKIRKGEFFTLLGPSGCGKTTLLRMIAGFEMPTSGSILLEGAEISDLPPNKRPVNTVFQSYALFPHLTVAQNIAFGLEMQGRPKAEVRETVSRMLALVKLEQMADRKTSQLSGGQQQRVALARALAPKPKVLLLDEPLSALDLKLRKEMQIELKRLQLETGITFIFVTHDQEEALTMSDRIAVMSEGRVQQIGSARDIYEAPVNRFVADFIGETNLLEVDVESVSDGRAQLTLPGGHRITCPSASTTTGRHHLSIRPERLSITEGAELAATVDRVVYLGTDLQVVAHLDGGQPITLRMQNTARTAPPTPGSRIGLHLEEGAARLLAD